MFVDKLTAMQIAHQTNKGYWSFGDRCYFSKIECLRDITTAAKKQPDVLHPSYGYHYFDEVFASLDWSKDPPYTLPQVYAERARQIREQYDYVLLMYSGGADSENMLNAFLTNGIKIDEIYSFAPLKVIDKISGIFDGKDTSPRHLMFEHKLVVEPRLAQISQQYPSIKITVADTTEDTLDIIDNEQMHEITCFGNMSPYFTYRKGLFDHANAIKGKVCILSGHDKPTIAYHPATAKFSAFFCDATISMPSVPEESRFVAKLAQDTITMEMFYYTKDFPQLWQTQCFAIKRAVESDPTLLGYLAPQAPSRVSTASSCYLDINHVVYEKILYPEIDIDAISFQVEKAQSFFFSETSTWFLNHSFVNKKTKDFYKGQVKEYIQDVLVHFIQDGKEGRAAKFKQMYTDPIHF